MSKGIKTGGREPGTPNKITKEIRDVYKDLIENNLCNIDRWLIEVSENNPDKALNFIIRLSEFVVPKLQNTQLTGNLERLSDEQIDYILNDIKNTINGQNE